MRSTFASAGARATTARRRARETGQADMDGASQAHRGPPGSGFGRRVRASSASGTVTAPFSAAPPRKSRRGPRRGGATAGPERVSAGVAGPLAGTLAPHVDTRSEEAGHAHRRLHLPDRVLHPHRRAGAGARGARLRVALRSRAHAHPGEPADALARRRPTCPRSTRTRSTPSSALAAAAAVTTTAPARHRDLPGDRARPDRHSPRRSPASTSCRTGASSSASAPAGTSRRWRTTAPPSRRASA